MALDMLLRILLFTIRRIKIEAINSNKMINLLNSTAYKEAQERSNKEEKRNQEQLIDKFATAALGGLLSNPNQFNGGYEAVADEAYQYASLMLEARKKYI